ncbi:hypothetical protein OHA40_13980 [Nocardia sp. NBC_00508]|uniref:hypothetical protein n=1 Tax=Nocardia sp. NBC_00508 TaxID=2975992 RepID=UPI002E8018AC|nr:hypothetical protein [Nocardia sp. NBC_00508]WUD69133.1 hypothetical protein OHA40_13980 [Nocardia sp. NBC_00508]
MAVPPGWPGVLPEAPVVGESGIEPEEGAGAPLAGPEADTAGAPLAGRDAAASAPPGFLDAAVGRDTGGGVAFPPLGVVPAGPGGFVALDCPLAGFWVEPEGAFALLAGPEAPPLAGRGADVPGWPGFPDVAVGREAGGVVFVRLAVVPAGVCVPLDGPVADLAVGCCAEPVFVAAVPAGPDAGEFLGAEPGMEIEGLVVPAGPEAVALEAPELPAAAFFASAGSGAAEFAFLGASAFPPGALSPPRGAPDTGPRPWPDAEAFAFEADSPASRCGVRAVDADAAPGRCGCCTIGWVAGGVGASFPAAVRSAAASGRASAPAWSAGPALSRAGFFSSFGSDTHTPRSGGTVELDGQPNGIRRTKFVISPRRAEQRRGSRTDRRCGSRMVGAAGEVRGQPAPAERRRDSRLTSKSTCGAE